MRILKSTTFLTPVAIALLPAAAQAQLTISTATTAPVRTSTAVNNAPADINVTADGSITLTSGSAITVDSSHAVTNAGKLALDGSANGATAIDVSAGTTGTITSSGTISIGETFTAPNEDANGIVDGPIASALDRTGIRVRGAHSGNITQSGTVAIEGLNSSGIRIEGPLTGTLRHWGTVSVRGDNSVGLHTQAVNGDLFIGGQVRVVGKGATAIAIDGDISGVLKIANAVGQSTSFTDDDGTSMTLARGDLRVNAPAMSVAGNVNGGILLAALPTTSSTNTDTDGDGIPDASQGSAVIQAYGNGAALRIGGTTNTTIGAVSGDTHGLINRGSVSANAYYTNTDATTLQIGGLGGNVTVTGGILNAGTIQATTIDSVAQAILIHAGSSVPVIDNSGTINAVLTSPGEGATYGIRDLSGTLTTINNTGTIAAGGTSQDITHAIDLSANTSGVTIAMSKSSTSTVTDSVSTPVASITGTILTGSGNDSVTASAGLFRGNSLLGAGNDTLALSGTSTFIGRADFGTGTGALTLAGTASFLGTAVFNNQAATMTLSDTASFVGQITGGSQLDVTVNGGTFEASGTSDLNFRSVNVGASGTLKVTIDTENQTNPRFNVGTATFASGAKIAATIDSLGKAEGNYVILTAGTITGTPSFAADETLLPILFKGAVSVNQTAGTVSLAIQRKTTTELGFNRNQAAIYPSVFVVAPLDLQVQESLLAAEDEDELKTRFNDMMPDHAGGNFDVLARGSRMAARHLTNNNAMFDISNFGGWFDVIKWSGDKDTSDTPAYRASGWGVSGGLERVTRFGNVGISLAWLSGKNQNRDNTVNEIKTTGYEIGAFWRLSQGPFYAFLRGAVVLAKFDSQRGYVATDASDTSFGRGATAHWRGKLWSSIGGASYQFDMNDRIALKPMVVVDFYRLNEKGYTETGAALTDGSDAIDLSVAPRTSTNATATTSLTGIYRFGPRTKDGIPLTIEVEGGYRNRLGGKMGDTVANFVGGGSSFRLTADEYKGGWTAEARLLSGGLDYTWSIAAGAQQTMGKPTLTARIGMGVAF
jgi:hypothetical protein